MRIILCPTNAEKVYLDRIVRWFNCRQHVARDMGRRCHVRFRRLALACRRNRWDLGRLPDGQIDVGLIGVRRESAEDHSAAPRDEFGITRTPDAT